MDDGAEPAENHVEVDEAEAATHPPYERPDAELLLFLKARDGRTVRFILPSPSRTLLNCRLPPVLHRCRE